MAKVSRDPFARTELHRTRVNIHDDRGCRECGQTNMDKRGVFYLFNYRTESDGGSVSAHPAYFCSTTCFKNYYS